MSDQKLPFTISHEYEVVSPPKERAFAIPESEWKHLKQIVERVQVGVPLFHTIGSVSLGIAGSALLAGLTLPRTEVNSNLSPSLICWVICSAAFIVGILSLCFSFRQRKEISRSKQQVLEEMEHLESRYSQS